MNKSRPERIELNTPSKHAIEFETMLNKYLHKNANLKRIDKEDKTTFIFYPTSGEYILVSMLFMAIGQSLGGTLIEEK